MGAFPAVEKCFVFLLWQEAGPGIKNEKTQMSRKEETLLPEIPSIDKNKDKTNKYHPVKTVKDVNI